MQVALSVDRQMPCKWSASYSMTESANPRNLESQGIETCSRILVEEILLRF